MHVLIVVGMGVACVACCHLGGRLGHGRVVVRVPVVVMIVIVVVIMAVVGFLFRMWSMLMRMIVGMIMAMAMSMIMPSVSVVAKACHSHQINGQAQATDYKQLSQSLCFSTI